MIIRPEQPADRSAIHQINTAAFDTPAEANLVDALRASGAPIVSLVAQDDAGNLVGHILFSPVTLPGHPESRIMGLAPMAVAPSHQRQGIGAALVKSGLDHCKQQRAGAVVVLGHPNYYPRFGFAPASRFNINSDYDVPDDVFLALELHPGALSSKQGTIRYHKAFGEL